MARSIEAIDVNSIKQLCSGQVIVDLRSCVKELVENSLDAGANRVEVKLVNYGGDLVEVIDDGSGIDRSNYRELVRPHATSKLTVFEDLDGVQTFGFRGEAIASICELSGSLTVTTCTASDSTGSCIEYSRSGEIVSEKPMSRQVGTTITVKDLFDPLPVRRKEMIKNIKKQYLTALQQINAYALISTKAKITCTLVNGGRRQTVLSTSGNCTLMDNILTLYGKKFASTLIAVSVKLRDDGEGGELGDAVEGYVSKSGLGVGRQDADRQFFFINGRPVNIPKVSRLLNATWRQYEMKQKPACVLNFVLKAGGFDINVTPDKREVMLTDEDIILERLKEGLERLWETGRYTFQLNQGVKPGFRDAPSAGTSSGTNAGAGGDSEGLSLGYTATPANGTGEMSQVSDNNAMDVEVDNAKVVSRNAETPLASTNEEIPPRGEVPPPSAPQGYVDMTETAMDLEANEGDNRSGEAPPPASGTAASHGHYDMPVAGMDLELGHDEGEEQALENDDESTVDYCDNAQALEDAGLAQTNGSSSGTVVVETGLRRYAAVGSGDTPGVSLLIPRSDPAPPLENSLPLPSPSPPKSKKRPRSEVSGGDDVSDTTGRDVRSSQSSAKKQQVRGEEGREGEVEGEGGSGASESGRLIVERRSKKREDSRSSSSQEHNSSQQSSSQLSQSQGSAGGRERPSSVAPSRGSGSAAATARATTSTSKAAAEVDGPILTERSSKKKNDRNALASSGDETSASTRSRPPTAISRNSSVGEDGNGSRDLPSSSGRKKTSSSSGTIAAATDDGGQGYREPRGASAAAPVIDLVDPPVIDLLEDSTPLPVSKKGRGGNPGAKISPVGHEVISIGSDDGSEEEEEEVHVSGGGGGGDDEDVIHAIVEEVGKGSSSLKVDLVVKMDMAAITNAVTARGGSGAATGKGGDNNSDNLVEGAESYFAGDSVTMGTNESERVLERILNKESFSEMQVLGQFNKGFIIARFRNDLFILDQHACDEKFNFETLQSSTQFVHQPLIQKLPLEVSAHTEITIMDNMPIFNKNGFHFHVNDEDTICGRRLSLTRIPTSKSIRFGVNDVLELASLLADNPTNKGKLVLPKVHDMFASRACRMSIMIGKDLTSKQMTHVVRNLTGLEQPWNCPHGRPTMRHLLDLEAMKTESTPSSSDN